MTPAFMLEKIREIYKTMTNHDKFYLDSKHKPYKQTIEIKYYKFKNSQTKDIHNKPFNKLTIYGSDKEQCYELSKFYSSFMMFADNIIQFKIREDKRKCSLFTRK